MADSRAMPSHAALFRYLRDCYRDNHRSGALLDVFASKVEARFVSPERFVVVPMSEEPESEERSDFEPFRHQRQKEMAQRAWLNRGEKQLLLGSFFLVGRVGNVTGRGRRICAPLWTWETARRGHDGIERSRAAINVALLRELLEIRLGLSAGQSSRDTDDETGVEMDAELDAEPDVDEEETSDDLPDELELALDGMLRRIPDLPATPTDLEQAAGVLREVLDVKRRSSEVGNAGDVRRLTSGRRSLGCVDCEMLIYRRRAIDSRGVLTELSRLAEEPALSSALGCLLDGSPANDSRPPSPRRIQAPATLSRPQQSVIRNAETAQLSLVIGPPGTGKSFTIAAATLDALSRGESVLIAAKTNHAVDVVADKLEAMLGLGEWAVRGGRREYRRKLADRLDRWLEGNLPPLGLDPTKLGRLESELKASETRVASLERRLEERSELEIGWGEHVVNSSTGTVETGWLRSLWSNWRHARRQAALDDSALYWDLMDAYRQAMDQRVELLAELLRQRVLARLRAVLSRDRATLARLRQTIHASVSLRETHFAELDQEALLRATPVWMVRTADAAQVLPLHRELFDLVIFDEATQCDIASAMPLIQRAKRCQVVGDPRQLRHLSFLSRRHQRRLAERRGLDDAAARRFDFRDASFLDLVNQSLGAQEQVAFLDEHFRSVPEIIEFSNREFYADRLRIMQEHPAQRFHRAMTLRRLDGRRGDDGSNPVEVTAVVGDVVDHVRRQADEPDELVHSLGVLSPLRAQVEALTSALAERLTDRELARHNVRVATAYGFQGEEPDVMFLSLAVDGDSHPSALRYLQRPDVFNVAITRARIRQLVYTSLTKEEVPDGLLGRYLEHVELGSEPPSESGRSHEDDFLRKVRSRLELDGARVWPEYSVAGMKVDVVVEKDGRCLGIDLVGFPGRFAGSFDLERYRIFNRAGLRLMPLPYSAWLRDAEGCVRAIEERLGLAEASVR